MPYARDRRASRDCFGLFHPEEVHERSVWESPVCVSDGFQVVAPATDHPQACRQHTKRGSRVHLRFFLLFSLLSLPLHSSQHSTPMTIIGIDVSKDTLDAARIDRRGRRSGTWTLSNTPATITAWLRERHADHPRLVIAAESTAEEHLPLATACLALGIPFRLVNPLTTKQFIRVTIRKQKTDRTDARVIARVAAQGEGTLLSPRDLAPLKVIARLRERLGRLHQTLRAMERRVERRLPQPSAVTDALAQARGALGMAAARVGTEAEALTDPALRRLLSSVPGVGPVLATTLIAELGEIRRFSSSAALIAYAGLDPKVRQSGRSLVRNTRITKRGSPSLRRALFLAAMIARRHDAELRRYAEKKEAEGKPYTVATVAVARRIATRVYAVWKRGTPYVIRPEESRCA
jgi:transposase